jgi:hypothetical protein
MFFWLWYIRGVKNVHLRGPRESRWRGGRGVRSRPTQVRALGRLPIIISYPRMVFDMKFGIYANASLESTLFYSAIMPCSKFVIQARPIHGFARQSCNDFYPNLFIYME